MSIAPFLDILRNGQLAAALRANALFGPFYTLVWIATAKSHGFEVLNLWGAAAAVAGRLPATGEMQQQLQKAGYAAVRTMRLIPGDIYYAFTAQRRA